ncbi:MAG: OsmC family protein [Anaerolineales bacterium]
MAVRTSSAEWKGNLKGGSGSLKLGSGVYQGPYTYASRFENGSGTNPEELIGAAHAACFSMFLSALLEKEGYIANSIRTSATVHLTDGPTISLIELHCQANVPGLSDETFQKKAAEAKAGCPVSKALAAVETRLVAELEK